MVFDRLLYIGRFDGTGHVLDVRCVGYYFGNLCRGFRRGDLFDLGSFPDENPVDRNFGRFFEIDLSHDFGRC